MKKIFKILLPFVSIIALIALAINFYVIVVGNKNLKAKDDFYLQNNIEAIVVLGCGVKEDGTPSRMLYERLRTAAELSEILPDAKLFLTGDHTGDYNELAAMKSVSLENGVSEDRIIIDEKGFSTWESLNNARNAGFENIVIVTQKYHQFRALYIAKCLGFKAYGVSAYIPLYPRQIIWSSREVLARNKDFFNCVFNTRLKVAKVEKAIAID